MDYINISQAELDIFAERLQKGPYKKKGDVSTNSPGDGDRIIEAAEKAIAEPQKEIWRKPTHYQVEEVVNGKKIKVTKPLGADTPIPKWTVTSDGKSSDPTSQGKGLLCLASLYAAEKDKKSAKAKTYGEAIRKIIIEQFNDRITDFTDTKVWKQELINDINPLFIACQWMGCYALSYHYGQDLFSSQEQKHIDDRLKAAAYFSVKEMSLGFNLTYNNWLEDDLTFRKDAGYRENEYKNKYSEKVMFDADPKIQIPTRALHYNNRRAEGYKLAALVGIMYNDETLIKYATRFYEDVMRFACMPLKVKDVNGKDRFIVLNCEMERGNSQFPEIGVGYSGAMINTIGDIADWLARSGRPHCINYKTREGNLNTISTAGHLDKSLENLIDSYNMVFDQEIKLYMRGELLDGHQASEGWDSEFHVPLCNLNLYFKRDDFRDSYLRKSKKGVYFDKPDGFGWSSVWMGAGGHCAGKMIMHAGLEGKVWPYKNSPQQPPTEQPQEPEYMELDFDFKQEKTTGIVRMEPGPDGNAVLIQNIGDRVSKTINVALPGTYKVRFRGRAGGQGGALNQVGGYSLIVKDQVGKETQQVIAFTGSPSEQSPTFGGSVWGDFVSPEFELEKGTYTFIIEAKIAWIGFYDLILEPVKVEKPEEPQPGYTLDQIKSLANTPAAKTIEEVIESIRQESRKEGRIQAIDKISSIILEE